MEGEGTRRIWEDLQSKNYSIGTFLHDGDSSSYKAVLESFPEASELFCVNHAGKNVGKFVKKSVSVEHWRKISTYWKDAARKASLSTEPHEDFIKRLETMLAHYGGKHDNCRHFSGRSYDQKDALTNEQLTVLRAYLVPHSLSASKYSHGRNQSLCESFNQSICVYAPKNVYAPILYRSRVYMAVCVRELGIEVAIPRLLSALNVSVRSTLSAFPQ